MATMSERSGLEIAIVGIACRAPGARNADEFWRNLCAGRDTISRFSEEELVLAGCDVDTVLRPDYVRAKGVSPDAFCFDHAFFGMTREMALITDPQQRVFLETAWHALEDAGYVPEEVNAIGVFAGSMESTYLQYVLAARHAREAMPDHLIGAANQSCYLPLQVSYRLNLCGPSVAVNSACSTSLVATHMACRALLAGECDMALAGGVALVFPEIAGYCCYDADAGALSPDGVCRPFDVASAGVVPGSGAVALLLKRLDDAEADLDHIYAIVRGSAVNNDGKRKAGFFAPSIEGQSRAIKMALDAADVDASSLCFIETHGTGTKLGDQIEVAALAEALAPSADGPRWLGSLKSNIGHGGEAAGGLSLAKAALALKHKHLPASLHVETENPALELAAREMAVARAPVSLQERDGRLYAGVNSLGIGGTNAFVILEAPPPVEEPALVPRSGALLLVSGRSEAQLKRAALDLAGAVEALSPTQLAHAAYTTQVGRKAHKYRLSVFARTGEEAAHALRHGEPASEALAPHSMSITEGHCRTGGVKQLVEAFPAVASQLRALLRSVSEAQRTPLEAELLGDAAGAELSAAASLLAYVALAAIWKRFGFQPKEVLTSNRAALVGAAIRGDVELSQVLRAAEEHREGSGGLDGSLPRPSDGALALDAAFAAAGPDNFLAQAAMLWRGGATGNWKILAEGRLLRRVPLPGYPFERVVSRLDLVSRSESGAAADVPSPVASPQYEDADFEDAQKVIETSIRTIWSELLEADDPASEDSFLDLGGDSLAVHRLAVRLRERFEIELPLKDLFEAQTITAQTQLVTAILLAKARAMLPVSSVEDAC
jgi:acyl transferase domain-containing protein